MKLMLQENLAARTTRIKAYNASLIRLKPARRPIMELVRTVRKLETTASTEEHAKLFTTIQDSNQELAHALDLMTPLVEPKTSTAIARSTLREMHAFSTIAARHVIRNKLTSILGGVEILNYYNAIAPEHAAAIARLGKQITSNLDQLGRSRSRLSERTREECQIEAVRHYALHGFIHPNHAKETKNKLNV
ncbi:hypothetical protein AUJ14_02260 [Candidatus Micrarchaeota archaeon CG1_02_55_22]|nr:MAG: hypothetical protein AUJ14_02260 [Candidatus Micrarchaeota archaeon CG1_02_55_22]